MSLSRFKMAVCQLLAYVRQLLAHEFLGLAHVCQLLAHVFLERAYVR
jgi:hypothetical protein